MLNKYNFLMVYIFCVETVKKMSTLTVPIFHLTLLSFETVQICMLTSIFWWNYGVKVLNVCYKVGYVARMGERRSAYGVW